jgi:hypothetical protein
LSSSWENSIDRRLLAALIERHGEPPPAPPPLSVDERERAEMVARRDRAMAAVDPALVEWIERHQRSAEWLARGTPAARAGAEAADRLERRAATARRPGDFDPEVWHLRGIGELRESEWDEDVQGALEHRTPQAVLRDLHRPVLLFGDVELRPNAIPSAASALAHAREELARALARPAGEAAHIALGSKAMREEMTELARVLAAPWQDARPESPLPMASRSPGTEDLQWFGMSGGYDPDV